MTAENLIRSASETLLYVFSESGVASYGRTMGIFALAGVWLASSERSSKQTRHAVAAHLPQGYDRSMLAAKLQSRYTKACVDQLLQIDQTRASLRTSSKEDKLRLIREFRIAVLVGLLSKAYLNALTIDLLCVKNAVRVMHFALGKTQQNGTGLGQNEGMLAAWWRLGTKALIMQRLAARMVGGSGGAFPSASPFAMDRLDETDMSVTMMMGEDTDSGLLEGDGSMRDINNISGSCSSTAAFSVRCTIERVTPVIIQSIRDIVTAFFEADEEGEAMFANPTVPVKQEAFEQMLTRVAEKVEKEVCVSEWLRTASMAPQPADPAPIVKGEKEDDEVEEEVVSFPRLSELHSQAALPPLPPYPHSTSAVAQEQHRAARRFMESPVLAAPSLDRSFQLLIHSVSFSELVMATAERMLRDLLRECCCFNQLKKYDEESRSVPSLIVVTRMEEVRQRVEDADFLILDCMKLFCEELLRCAGHQP